MEKSIFKSQKVGHKIKKSWLLAKCIQLANIIIEITGKAYWIRKALEIQVERRDFFLESLPNNFDGLKLLHLSDLHIDKLPGIEKRISKLIQKEDFDLVLLTGDYRDDYKLDFSCIYPQLKQIVASIRSKYGILAVLGNHDSHQAFDVFNSIGVKTLINETVELRIKEQSVLITGIDDVHYFYSEKSEHAMRAAPNGFKIMVAHSPEMLYLAEKLKYDFYLTGHTHGGQVCLPIPIVTHGAKRKYSSGNWKFRRMQGYTSRGAGVSTIPMRLNCPGEVGVLTLRSLPREG